MKRDQQFFQLQSSEAVILQTAAQILSAYVATGQVTEANATGAVERSVALAIALARKVEDTVRSDEEPGPSGAPA